MRTARAKRALARRGPRRVQRELERGADRLERETDRLEREAASEPDPELARRLRDPEA